MVAVFCRFGAKAAPNINKTEEWAKESIDIYVGKSQRENSVVCFNRTSKHSHRVHESAISFNKN